MDILLKKIVVFASGGGTNAENIVRYFEMNGEAEVVLIVCNNPEAGVVERARRLDVPLLMVNRKDVFENGKLLSVLEQMNPDLIVLAGWLWLIPEIIIHAFPKKIINIHPGLLPEFGGKGMFGMHVHNAVIASGKQESGITIHYVDEHYDHGAKIFSAVCEVAKEDSAESLAQKIHLLEQEHFPRVIRQLLREQNL